jgi:hypothetical protein
MKARLSVLCLVLSALLIPGVAAGAEEGAAGFRSPSKNIACQYIAEGKSGTLRCDIVEMASRPRRPADCDLEWGDAFEISATGGKGARICHGDTVMDSALPVLAYGSGFARGGFSCTSESNGVTCRNASQHGFTLSRTAQTVF